VNKEMTTFPKIPVKHWWVLRNKFKQSLPNAVTTGFLATALGMQEKSAKANILPGLISFKLILPIKYWVIAEVSGATIAWPVKSSIYLTIMLFWIKSLINLLRFSIYEGNLTTNTLNWSATIGIIKKNITILKTSEMVSLIILKLIVRTLQITNNTVS